MKTEFCIPIVCRVCLLFFSAMTPLVARPYTFSNLAGLPGTSGNSTGQGTTARLNQPFGVAVDLQGNAYVADYNNHVIRKVTPDGLVSDWVGGAGSPGSTNANGTAARLNFPVGVAVAANGTLYVADTGNHTIRKVSPTREVTTLAGLPNVPGSSDGTGGAARFLFPNGVAVGPAGSVYVADTYNHTIRHITSGGVVTTVSGQAGVPGSNDGGGPASPNPARLNTPTGVFYNTNGSYLIIADYENHCLRLLLSNGNTSLFAGAAGQANVVDGSLSTARFNHPLAVTVDVNSNIYVTDYDGHTVRKITEPSTSAQALVTTIAGSKGVTGTASGSGASARFNRPAGIAVTFDGMLLVADATNHRLSRGLLLPGAGEYYWGGLAGLPGQSGHADGTRGEAWFGWAQGLDTDAAGNVYVADKLSHTVRRITPAGVVTTVAGIPNNSGSEDSVGVTGQSRLRAPQDVALDASGNLYIADSGNYTIRRLSSDGVMSTVAGTAGQPGHVNATGAAARFGTEVSGIGVGPDQHLYIADTFNNVVRRMSPSGEVSALAGSPGQTGFNNGSGTAARFVFPRDVAVNAAGVCYVSDYQSIRAITPTGGVTTFAGSPLSDAAIVDGSKAEARFYLPYGLAVDREGVLFLTDDSHVRRILPSGHVSTLSGSGDFFDGLVFGPGKDAFLRDAVGIAVGVNGNLIVACNSSTTIAVGTPQGSRLQWSGGGVHLTFGADPYGNYVLERSTTLAPAQWTTLATPGANFSGLIQHTAPSPPPGKAFYRLRPQ